METTYDHKYKSYFTRAEVAKLFEVSPNTVSRWVRDGKIPSVLTPGGRHRYPVEEIIHLVRDLQHSGQTVSPDGPKP